jgi:N-acetylmuramic acid 6-phosphate (MurNAc-6-P) etherase
MRAAEQAEDNPVRGASDLQALEVGADRILFIGVTCGLSAPYVAGQLRQVCNAPAGQYAGAVLLGFNQETQARRSVIEGWDRTFAEELAATRAALASFPPTSAERTFFWLCNPAVGPEALSGSTRMKVAESTLSCTISIHVNTAVNDIDFSLPTGVSNSFFIEFSSGALIL